MLTFRSSLASVALVFALLAPAAHAQGQAGRQPPRLGFVYPAGGQVGETITVSVGGQNLTGTTAAFVSGDGVTARVIAHDRPLNQKELNDLREKQQQLLDKRTAARTDKTKPPFTAEDEAMATEIRQKLATRGNRQISPAIAETITLEVVLASVANPGERELRLRTNNGLSNPLVFVVGQLPEFSEKPVTATTNPAGLRPNRAAGARGGQAKTPPLAVTLPATVNGQILPGEVDRIQFPARQGQRVVVAASARTLIPYLADAVPGWFQATLSVRDARGHELAYNDDFRFSPDPVLSCEIPADGTYTVEIKDAIYRGREDFVYRIALGELPFITGIFPLGCQVTHTTTFELTGWNLPAATATLDTASKLTGTLLISVPRDGQRSNDVRFALDPLPDSTETEPNSNATTATPLGLPCVVNGRIERPDDEDVFRFEGKAGAAIVAEITARRLNSPLDSLLQLTDSAGRQIAANDDFEDKGAGLLTHHSDSRITATLPADGTYFLRVTDTQHRGGRDYAYRLRVSPPRPDFALRIVPSSINIPAGATVPVTVYALRHDGFAGEIALGLRDAPFGFALAGARIPAGQDKVQLTLGAPPTPSAEPFALTVVGLAKIDGRQIAHLAVPTDDMMQAFAYRHLVPAKELRVAVVERTPVFRVLNTGVVRIRAGGSVRLAVASPASRFMENLQFALVDAPEGFSVTTAKGGRDTTEIVISTDAAKVHAGLQGNLIISASGERRNPAAKQPPARGQRGPVATLPAVPFEIVAGSPST